MSNANDLGTGGLGGNFVYGGLANTKAVYDTQAFQGSAFQPYAGTANNMAGVEAQGLTNSQGLFIAYAGYSASFTGAASSVQPVGNGLMDNQPLLTWPKNQQIYYKLVGYNTSTQTFETWVIAEEIVPRTETFDPTGNFPNVDYGVYFTPPSGNKLSNIKIVARWIQ